MSTSRVRGALRAKIIGLGLDGPEETRWIVQSDDCLMIGGSEQTRAEMVELALRLEVELERLGRGLGDLAPSELAMVGWRIDAPELVRAAMHLDSGLRRSGRHFRDLSAEELTAMAWCEAELE
jgi:hypothetical protein